MAQQRVLLVGESASLGSLRQPLARTGFQLDAATPSEAPARLRKGRHALAVVRFDGTEAKTVAALKAIDHTLPVVALFAKGSDAVSEPLACDGLLVEPLNGPMVVSCCRAMARVAVQARHIVELAQRNAELTQRNAELEKVDRQPRGDGYYDYEFFKKLLLMEVKRSRRYRYPTSLALVAVDRWNELSAPLTESVKAALLAEFLQVISRAIRDIDLALIYSRDRFLIFMPHTDAAGSLQVVNRMCQRVRSHRAELSLTVSTGVASFEGVGAVSFAALVRQATKALAQAQAGGGDRAVGAGAVPKRSRISIG